MATLAESHRTFAGMRMAWLLPLYDPLPCACWAAIQRAWSCSIHAVLPSW